MDLLPVEDALRRVLSDVELLPAERIPLAEASGRVLAEPVIADRSQPAFAASSMDGYALRSADTGKGVRLRIVGQSVAGQRFAHAIGPGEAVRIFTGAPVPEGADAVQMQEAVVVEAQELVLVAPVPAGQFIRPGGMDFAAGGAVLRAGVRLGPRQLGLAAAANQPLVSARRRPRVAVLSIGDELVLPGDVTGPDQTIASNAFAMVALAAAAGADSVDLGLAADDATTVARIAGQAAATADVLVTIGGASVGDRDVTRDALKAAGMDLAFWRIAMRPGRPMAFGRIGPLRVLGVPGNPVSSYVCGLVFVQPLLAALLGLPPEDRSKPAILGVDLPANDGRTAYLRARLERADDALPRVTPLGDQDSSLLSVLAEADCLLIRPAMEAPMRAGAVCRIIRLP